MEPAKVVSTMVWGDTELGVVFPGASPAKVNVDKPKSNLAARAATKKVPFGSLDPDQMADDALWRRLRDDLQDLCMSSSEDAGDSVLERRIALLSPDIPPEWPMALIKNPAITPASVPPPAPHQVSEHVLQGLPSLGSVLHAQGKCRPCMWVWSESGCAIGASCRYCHICRDRSDKQRCRPCKGKRMHYNKMLDKVLQDLELKAGKSEVPSPALGSEVGAAWLVATPQEKLDKVSPPGLPPPCSRVGSAIGRRPFLSPGYSPGLISKPQTAVDVEPTPNLDHYLLQGLSPDPKDLAGRCRFGGLASWEHSSCAPGAQAFP